MRSRSGRLGLTQPSHLKLELCFEVEYKYRVDLFLIPATASFLSTARTHFLNSTRIALSPSTFFHTTLLSNILLSFPIRSKMVKPSAGWVSLLFLGNWVGLSVQQSGEVPFSTKGLEMVYQGVTANMAASLDQFMPQLYDHG